MDFDLRAGEVHALCGENGAGKSTLIKILSGIHPHGAYQGELYLREQAVRFASVVDAKAAGIAVIYQELALVPEMTVEENIFLGCEPTRRGLLDREAMTTGSKTILQRFGSAIDPAAKVCDLGIGQQQSVEIVKALRNESKILILDEPTAALSEREVDILLPTLSGLRQQGIGIVYISHKLDEVMRIADRISVLRDGRTVSTQAARDTGKQEIIHQMVGREIRELYPRRKSRKGDVLLQVKGLTVRDSRTQRTVLKDVSWEVCAGEVLGIGGLMGAGRSELFMHLFGAWGLRTAGQVLFQGRVMDRVTPETAIRAGLALVTEDRRRYGLILEQSIGFNLSLSILDRLTRAGTIDSQREHCLNHERSKSLGIKAPGLGFPVKGLSGGNQQKTVLGKALASEPSVIFLDEPTRGVDVGAKHEIYEIVNRLTDAGKAVVLASSEMPELLGISDRILMLHEGSVGGYFDRQAVDQEALLAAAMGHAVAA